MIPFPDKKYGAILADPPWPMRGAGAWKSASPGQHYALMTVSAIKALPVHTLIDPALGAHLWMWTCGIYLPDALAIMEEWSFRFVTTMVWDKRPHLGLGQYFRNQHELLLFGVSRCKTPPYLLTAEGKRRQARSIFTAKMEGHSVKPTKAHEAVELVSPAPRLEMFARRARPGWTTWGLEAPTATRRVKARAHA